MCRPGPWPCCCPPTLDVFGFSTLACREKYDRLLELHRHLPVKVWFPMAGFWRDYVGVPIPPAGEAALQLGTACLRHPVP